MTDLTDTIDAGGVHGRKVPGRKDVNLYLVNRRSGALGDLLATFTSAASFCSIMGGFKNVDAFNDEMQRRRDNEAIRDFRKGLNK